MNPASAVAASTPLIWGPYTSALFVDPGAFDGLFTSRPALEEGSGDEVLSGESPSDVYNDVRPALTLLLGELNKTGFHRYGVRFVEPEALRTDSESFLNTVGKVLAVFGEGHPEEYRGALRAAVGKDVYPELNVTADNLDAFVRLTNWKARKERELFWKRVEVEEKRSKVAHTGGGILVLGGIVVAGVGGFLLRPILTQLSFEMALLVGGIALCFSFWLGGMGMKEIWGALSRERQLTQEIVSPDVSPVFPEFLPAESRHDPDVVGKLFSGKIKHWIHASLRDGTSVP